MARPLRPAVLAVLALALAATELAAQTTVAFVEPCAPDSVRALGLGGAFIGFSDDSSTTVRNPAGLSSVPRSLEGLVGALDRDYDWRLSGSAGLRPTQRVAVGLQFASPPVGVAHVVGGGPTDGVLQSRAKVTDLAAGAAFLWGAQREFSAGASVQVRKLSVDEFTPVDEYAGSFTVGVLFRPVIAWSPRLALSYRHGSDWEFSGQNGASYHVRDVPIISAGASWYYEPLHWFRVSFSVQPDLLLYSQLKGTAGDLSDVRNDIDLRAGLEATIPMACWTGCGTMIQLRAGIVNSAALPFAAHPAPASDLAYRRTTWSLGAAVALDQIFQGRLKLEAAYDERSKTLAFGVGFRYPESFRADIVDITRRP